jgi:hypothetical protein
MNAPASSEKRRWVRGLRPLFYWLLLVLVLFSIRTHQRLIEQTRITFSVVLQDAPALDAVVSLDGLPVMNGMKISLGRHTFTVRHSKAEPFTANFFAWYGPQDFGKIKLQRSEGTLNIQANPPAAAIIVTGPEFSATLVNCSATNLTVPTDFYTVHAKCPHWSQSQSASVAAHQKATCEFSPRVGAVKVSCNQADVTGRLLLPDGQTMEAVVFPYSAADLPEGTYKFTAQHNHDTVSQTAIVMAGKTNALALEFSYGSLTLETEPSGALVRTSDGQYWGMTPLKLAELKPGQFYLSLQHNGYELATVSLTITANQATTFQTNLVVIKDTTSSNVSPPPDAGASTFRSAPPSDNLVVLRVATPVARPITETPVKPRAIEVPKPANDTLARVNDATVNQANTSVAEAEQRKAAGLRSLQRAKLLASQGNYDNAAKALAVTLKLLPDNQEAKALLAECRLQLANAKPQADQSGNGKKPAKNTSQTH